MKNRLNFLCVIVLLVLSYSIIETAYYFSLGVGAGIEKSTHYADEKELQKYVNIQLVELVPDYKNYDSFLIDSVFNEKSSSYAPASYGRMIVSVDTHQGKLSSITLGLIGLVVPITMVWALVLFIKVIIAINRSNIFNWRNVKRLFRMGVLLIICFCCKFLSSYIALHEIREEFSVSGYSLSMPDFTETTTLLLGLLALIVAEVFAIGLRLKEEQDLTI